jgi:hypothetical protein
MNNNPYGDIKKSVCIYIYIYWAFFLGFWGSFSVFCQLLWVSFWCFLCIFPVYQGASLRFFNKSFLTYQKKVYIYFFMNKVF